MLTVVGDPLYRPFSRRSIHVLAHASIAHTEHDDWLLCRRSSATSSQAGSRITLIALRAPLRRQAGPLPRRAWATFGKVERPAAGLAIKKAYRKAMTRKAVPVDQIRIGLSWRNILETTVRTPAAQAELKSLRELYPVDARLFGVASPLVPTSEKKR